MTSPAPGPSGTNLFDIEGRVALVTGASSGLGEAVARTLSSAGARVAVVARRAEQLGRVADSIGGYAVCADLSELERITDVVESVAGGLGPPEILVNVAGNRFSAEPAEAEPLDAIVRTLMLNVVAPFRLAQEVHRHMLAVGRGSIVNVSSISGHVGVPGIPQASYAASKMALSGLTTELAVQWAPQSIRVNTIAPGFFRSEITESLYGEDRGRAWLRRHTPLPYDGTVDDFVGTVLCLVSDAGRYITGQTVVVDGGWTAR